MKPAVKDFLNTAPQLVSCSHLYKISGGNANEGGDYDAAQRWLAENGYRYQIEIDTWVKA